MNSSNFINFELGKDVNCWTGCDHVVISIEKKSTWTELYSKKHLRIVGYPKPKDQTWLTDLAI